MGMCDACGKNPANVHVKKMVNGQVEEKHLCSQCAKEQGLFGQLFSPFAQMMAGMTGESVRPQVKGVKCSACGFDFSQFKETGLLGCPQCYQDFAPYLKPMIRRIQGGLTHLGERPGQEESNPAQLELASLKKQLAQAVDQEEYEKAAELRDRIRQMTSKEENDHAVD